MSSIATFSIEESRGRTAHCAKSQTHHHGIHEVSSDEGVNAPRSAHQSAEGIEDGAAQRTWGGGGRGERNKEPLQIQRAQDPRNQRGKKNKKNFSATLERWNGGNAHLPGRPPGRPSPLRSLCGPVPAGSPAAAAAAGCPRCARLYNEVEEQQRKKRKTLERNKEVR